jgi:hypothetical protein
MSKAHMRHARADAPACAADQEALAPRRAAREQAARRTRGRRLRAALSALAVAALVAGGGLLGAVGPSAPAQAAAKVTIEGGDSLDPDGETQLKLKGTGFQSVQGGFGGIYVLFGWAKDGTGGGWRPSEGGKTGEDYRYVYDDETKPAGFQLFVTFPGSSTADAANGGQINADGTWEATLRVPGAKFESYDRSQNVAEVDCLADGCGIMTIGAHGVVNANNETFTPVSFAGGSGGGDGGGEEESEDAEAAADAPEAEDAEASPETAAADPGTAQQAAVPAAADPELLAAQQRQTTLLAVLLGVGIVLTLCVVGLAFGIGGYLAMKSLLLGVNPEALEKVRARREARAVRAEAKRRRRISAIRRREEIRSQRAEARDGGRVARATMDSPETGASTADEALMRFFAGGDDVAVPTAANGAAQWATPAHTPAAEDADTQSVDPVGGTSATPSSEARTTVLTHVKEDER